MHSLCIIDDDESVRRATTCLLRSLGYVAYTFASAEEFLHSPYVTASTDLSPFATLKSQFLPGFGSSLGPQPTRELKTCSADVSWPDCT